MTNADTAEALRYHRATNHSHESIRESGHWLDWANKPLLYKIFPGLDPIPLPREMALPGVDALRAVSASAAPPRGATGDAGGGPAIPPGRQAPVDLPSLASLLFLSGGIIRKIRHGGSNHHFRAASCAGALYPVEIYPVVGAVPGLQPGVYHFNPADFALRRLRTGDFRAALAQAAGDSPELARAPVTFVLSAIFWRSAWKYQARCYRYCFWDAGTMGANLAATATALGLPSRFHLGFDDTAVNRLVGADGRCEAALALAPVGDAGARAGPPPEAPDLSLETVPLAAKERAYPELERLHAASVLEALEVVPWKAAAGPPAVSPAVSLRDRRVPDEGDGRRRSRLDAAAAPGTYPAGSTPPPPRPPASLVETIRQRGSARRFAREPLPAGHLDAVLRAATRGVSADFLEPGAALTHLFVNVHAADGLGPGAYRFDRTSGLRLLKPGDLRDRSGYLCLEQPLGADAAATIFMLADLDAVLRRFGNRGYRAVQFEAGVVGGRLYLGAYSLGFGATGLTFYDDDVTEFFQPEARGKSCIFVVALGIPAYGKGRDRLRLVNQD